MVRVIGGVTVTARRVERSERDAIRIYPDWMYVVPPNHEATLARAREEASLRLMIGKENRVWICRSRHKLAGVIDYRYFCLTEEVVRLLGGHISSEVIEIHEQEELAHGTSKARKAGKAQAGRSGRNRRKQSGGKSGRKPV